MRRAAKVDANQAEIVGFLREIPGVSVVSLAAVGSGVPDLLIGFRGQNWLIELKDPDKPPSDRKLTDKQKRFHDTWRGQVAVAETFGEIVNIMQGRS